MTSVETPLLLAPFDPHEQQWRAHAACSGRIELFFGKPSERPEARVRREAKAKQLCAECPVILQCREASQSRAEYGLWGGESEEDRFLAGVPVGDPAGLRRRIALRTG
ncbi:MAG: WhiB family transcriptional regulator [Actinomycetota bacterium]